MNRNSLSLIVIGFALLILASCQSQAASPKPATVNETATLKPFSIETEVPAQEVEPTATQQVEPTEMPDIPIDDPRQTVLTAMDKVRENAFRAQSTIIGEDTFEYLVVFQPPDRYSYSGPFGEMIFIGEKSYLNVGGVWSEPPIDASGVLNSFLNFADVQEISEVQYLGTETLDGLSALVVTYNTEIDFEGSIIRSSHRLWIAEGSGLPMKVEAEGELESNKTFTTIIYDFDPTIEIKEPNS